MPHVLVASLPYLLQGALVTLWLSILVVGVGTLLGTGIGILATVSRPTVQRLITVYVFILRGVPVLVVMFLGYYLFPAVGYRVNAYVAVGAAQIVYVSAFVAEIIRSAIASVPPLKSPRPRGWACAEARFFVRLFCPRPRESPSPRSSTT